MNEDVTWRPIGWGGEVKAHLIVAGDILSLCGVAQLDYATADASEKCPPGLPVCGDCERIALKAAEMVDEAKAPEDGPRCRVCGCSDGRACVATCGGKPCPECLAVTHAVQFSGADAAQEWARRRSPDLWDDDVVDAEIVDLDAEES